MAANFFRQLNEDLAAQPLLPPCKHQGGEQTPCKLSQTPSQTWVAMEQKAKAAKAAKASQSKQKQAQASNSKQKQAIEPARV